MREARAYIGVREIPGKQHNPTILGWAKGLGVKALGIAVNDDETPWCGLFVAHCLKSCGLPTAPIAVRAKAWANYGSALNSPRYGAIAVFGRQGGGHVGFVVGQTATTLKILGGNQKNAVNIIDIAKDRLIALRWPAGIPLTAEAPFGLLGAVSENEA